MKVVTTLLPTAAEHGSCDSHSIMRICANMYYHDSAHRLTGGIYSGLERKEKAIWLLSLGWNGRTNCFGADAEATCGAIIHPFFFFSRLYIVTTSLRYGFFLPDFMIGLRAKWNSRDQLTDNYHIALIRTYYFCSSLYRCERIHSVFACNRSVWFSLPIILGIWVRRFQNSIHIAENQR